MLDTVDTKSKIGQAGLEFKLGDPKLIRRAMVWCDGGSESSQTTPFVGGAGHFEQWWPCIALYRTRECVAFY